MRCDTTRFAQIEGCVAAMTSNACTRLKKARGRGAGNTADRANPPSVFAYRKEGLVLKPMASLYATRVGLAVTSRAQSVTFSTVSVMAQ